MTDPPILHFETIGSTMDEMAAMLASSPVEPWTALLADFQSHGRGRAERAWHAEPGAALLATIYAPIKIESARVGMVAIAAGLAVANTVRRHRVAARLKWPNDVLANDLKLAGILISSRIGETTQASVGIGLNVAGAPPGGISLSTFMPEPPTAIELLAELRLALRRRWTTLEAGGFRKIADEWNALAAWRDEVVVVPGDEPIKGHLLGVDEWGRLQIDSIDGVVTISESEILRGPRPDGGASYTSC